jgi:hypothetical protein
MSIRKLSMKVYNKIVFNVGDFPTWEQFAKASLEEKINKGETCVTK